MGSKGLTSYSSVVVANKASLSSCRGGSLGSVPRSIFFSFPTGSPLLKLKTSSNSKPLLVVRAQQQYGGQPFSPPPSSPGYNIGGGQPFSPPPSAAGYNIGGGQHELGSPTPGLVHSPWYTTEDERAVRMRMDMPGLGAEELDVKVEGDMLVIKDLGRQIFSPYNAKIQLPPDCVKENAEATLKNGVLSVTVPKRFPPNTTVVHIPVRTSSF